ncbi:hypothetical protein B4086_5570 [Bacillus cereus]|nr:hypothetical protein B4086_5570 [Bacillus cereus]
MSLKERREIRHVWGMQIEGLEHILQEEKTRILLNEGHEQGFRDFVGESANNVKWLERLFAELTTFLTGKNARVFEVWDGWLVPLSGGRAFKLLHYVGGVKGLIVYRDGLAYRVFKHDEKDWYTVSVTESTYIREFDTILRKMS